MLAKTPSEDNSKGHSFRVNQANPRLKGKIKMTQQFVGPEKGYSLDVRAKCLDPTAGDPIRVSRAPQSHTFQGDAVHLTERPMTVFDNCCSHLGNVLSMMQHSLHAVPFNPRLIL